MNKVALVTGADKGIGFEIARRLVSSGLASLTLNGHRGYQTVEEGAREPVRLALLSADGPSGGFFDATGPEPW